MALAKSINRILALTGKELVEVIRRPGAMLSLVLGPFLILAIFGFGYQGYKANLRTIVVVPSDSGLSQDVADYQGIAERGITIVDVTEDESAAVQRLRDDEVDLVVVAPANAWATFESGQQSELVVVMNQTDPVQANYAGFLAETLATGVNREIYRQAAKEGQGYALSHGEQRLSDIPPDVVAAPVKASTRNLAPTSPGILDYFGPAALALVLQHMAVALVALSVVRERRGGAIDLFRVAPVRTTEIVLGKLLSYGFLGGLISVISLSLLVGVLHVPILGSIGMVVGTISLLLLASLGLGLLISIVSDSERQAVQLALLALLASMFFSGFVLRTEEFNLPVQIGSYVLPVTHGIKLLQDILLRGTLTHPWMVAALGAIAGALVVASWLLLRRELRPVR